MSDDEVKDIREVLEAVELWIIALVRLAVATTEPSTTAPEYEIIKALRDNLLKRLIEATKE